MRGTVSKSSKKRKRRRIRELEKAASHNHSIKTMFAAQKLRTSPRTYSSSENTPSRSLIESNRKEVFENGVTIKTRAVYDLSELL